MLRFDERRLLRRVVFSWPIAGALVLLTFFLGSATWHIWQKERITAERRSQSRRELRDVSTRETELRAEIERLTTARGQEEEVRSKFEVARPGEKVIVIVDAPADSQTAGALESSLWVRILGWFGL